jgi:hypothetical protein
MSSGESHTEAAAAGPFSNPWPAMITAGSAAVCAWAVELVGGGRLGSLLLLLAAVSVLAAGVAVAVRPGSPQVVFLAALVALAVSWVGSSELWDSGRLALRVLAAVGLFAAGVLLLPSPWRRVAVSLVILFHFAGICVAVTSADNLWVSHLAWRYFYRPYVQFMYLNNAYHFYAPAPGPAPLLWFCVEYQPDPDGRRNLRWVKVPEIDKDGKRLRPDGSRLWPNVEYTRRLSLAESTNFPQGVLPGNLVRLSQFRDSEVSDPQSPLARLKLPLSSQLAFGPDVQYREPTDVSKKWIASYARHVARTYRHETRPDLPVVGVKVYRVIHTILSAQLLAAGARPDDPELFQPYFMGEFDAGGRMKSYPRAVRLWRPDGQEYEEFRDPLLYWLIPIVRTGMAQSPAGDAFRERGSALGAEAMLREYLKQEPTNFLAVHAGDLEGGNRP